MLKNQIHLYSVDCKDFYSKEEQEINKKIIKLSNSIKAIKEYELYKYLLPDLFHCSSCIVYIWNKYKYNRYEHNSKLKRENIQEYIALKKYFKLLETKLNQIAIQKYSDTRKAKASEKREVLKNSIRKSAEFKLILEGELKKSDGKKKLKKCAENIIGGNRIYLKYIDRLAFLKIQLNNYFLKYNNRPRTLKSEAVFDRNGNPKLHNRISEFESALTRILGINTNELMLEMFTLNVVYYDVLEQLINNGFWFKNGNRKEKYVIFTASAGQTRLKKIAFIKESVLSRYQKTIMCGLTIDEINKCGGTNINKYLSYLALVGSATDVWKGFDIDRAIVVRDFESTVKGEVDYIDNKTFEITRTSKKIKIAHSDGAGWVLSSKEKKAFQCRLPWIKGLMIPVPFLDACELFGNYKVTDIYGKEWDLKADNIHYVFSESQFKMHKYYKNIIGKDSKIIKYGWDIYKDRYKKYKCQAGKCNEEESNFEDKTINYQCLQSLFDMTDDEIDSIIEPTKEYIISSYKNVNQMLDILGVNEYNQNPDYLQQALKIYPELLQDKYIKDKLGSSIRSTRKDAKYGKLKVDSKRVFIAPDVFAWMEYIIGGVKRPKGLLQNGQVACKLYKTNRLLDVLRSPHLSFEHAIRKNVYSEDNSKWFCANMIYVSCHDLISKIIMNDWDGDTSLVVAEESIVNCALRMLRKHKFRPLYYEMYKAKPELISNESIYNSLKTAYKYSNIGEYSNAITARWNQDKPDLYSIAILTMQNNFSIDAAKTGELPLMPDEVKNKIYKDEVVKVSPVKQKVTIGYKNKKINLPYFFKFAKDYSNEKVDKSNNSVMNRICNKIEEIGNKQYDFSSVRKFDYRKLMNKPGIELDQRIIDKFDKLDKQKNLWFRNSKMSKKKIKQGIYYTIEHELLKDFPDINLCDMVDILVKYMFTKNKNFAKTTLFECFGSMIVKNLKRNVQEVYSVDYFYCKDCGKQFPKTSPKQKRCEECAKKENSRKTAERKKLKKTA